MTVFVIEELWIDSLENRDAMGYTPIGFVLTEEDAIAICTAAGWQDGTGWPIKLGEQALRKRYSRLSRLDP